MSKEYTTDNIYIDGYLSDGSGSGTSGQVLSSTGGGVSWINGSAIPGTPGGSGTVNTVPCLLYTSDAADE